MKKNFTVLKSLYFLLLFILTGINSKAQVYERRINWNLSTTNFAQLTACAHRANGNNLIAIRQSYQTGQGAAALAEINGSGDTLWMKKFNRAGTLYGENYITFIREMPDHSLFLAGFTHNSSGFYHAALWLADSVGAITNYQQISYNTYREISFNDIDVADDGSIYFAGNYFDLFSGGVSYYTWTVPIYGKLNPDLTLAWANTWGSTNHTNNNNNRGNVVGIKVSSDNNLIVLGSDAVDFGNGYNGTLQLAKVTSGGVIIWTKQREQNTNSFLNSMTLGNNDEIYVLTNFSQPIPGNNHRYTLEKFNSSGNLLWTKSIGSGNPEGFAEMKFNPLHNQLVLAGNYFHQGTFAMAMEATVDTAGNPIQSKYFGVSGTGNNIFNDVCFFGNSYLFAGNAYTFGAMLVQTDLSGNTGCSPNNISMQSAPFTGNPYTLGIYHGGINLTFTPFSANYINNPVTSVLSCLGCSDVTVNTSVSSCGSYFVGGALQTLSGIYYDTLSVSGGCDSIIVTNLTIYQNPTPANAGIDQQICNNSAGLNANVATTGSGLWTVQSGSGNIVNPTQANTGVNNLSPGNNVLRWTITNGTCPSSFDEVNIFVGNQSTATYSQTGCDSITLNNQTFTSSGTYTQTLVNSQGCDSILSLTLTIINSSASNLIEQACNSYTLNNQTYTTGGIFTQTLTNAQGCDSILTLDLTMNYDATATLVIQSCEAYTLNQQLYDSTGIYVQNLSTAAGCDSTLTLELTVTVVDTGVTNNFYYLSSNASGAQYQWIDCNSGAALPGETNANFTPAVNGDYAVVVTQNNCSDTSACYPMYSVGLQPENATFGFSILPNPSKDEINILLFGVIENSSLEIISAEGKTIMNKNISTQSSSVDISELAPGVYFVRMTNREQVKFVKLIKR